jgi:hypothetical protein
MLQGIRIYTASIEWRKILGDLGAVIAAAPSVADIDFDSLDIVAPLSALELKSVILSSIDKKRKSIVFEIFGQPVVLPGLQLQIVVLLRQTGGMSAGDLKAVLGISPEAATHATDAAIYQLRKTYGRDFIKNENGKYSIGKL